MASVHLSPIASAFQCLETADGDHHPHTPFCSAGAPTLATLLRKPLQENCNTQAPTPESTPSPPKSSDERKRLAKLEARKTTRSAAVIWAPKKKQSSLQQDLMPYLQYRARQRRDAGPNRDSVWDDEVEKAFMEGMISIIIAHRVSLY